MVSQVPGTNGVNGANGTNGTHAVHKQKRRIAFDDYLDCSALLFDWAHTYDTKDWAGLAAILAPEVSVAYNSVNNVHHPSMPASKFLEMMQDPLFLGDPLIASQHLIGATKWEVVSDDEVVSRHQSRAAHVRNADDGLGESEGIEANLRRNAIKKEKDVAAKGHGHGIVTTTFKRIDGVWKWAGISTMVIFNEYEFERVFKGIAGKED